MCRETAFCAFSGKDNRPQFRVVRGPICLPGAALPQRKVRTTQKLRQAETKTETGGLRLSPCQKSVVVRNENRETDGISARKRGSWTPFPGRKTKGPHDFEAKSGCLKS